VGRSLGPSPSQRKPGAPGEWIRRQMVSMQISFQRAVSRVDVLQGDHLGRRERHAVAPDHPGAEQAASARLRQAHGVLPAYYSDAGGDS